MILSQKGNDVFKNWITSTRSVDVLGDRLFGGMTLVTASALFCYRFPPPLDWMLPTGLLVAASMAFWFTLMNGIGLSVDAGDLVLGSRVDNQSFDFQRSSQIWRESRRDLASACRWHRRLWLNVPAWLTLHTAEALMISMGGHNAIAFLYLVVQTARVAAKTVTGAGVYMRLRMVLCTAETVRRLDDSLTPRSRA